MPLVFILFLSSLFSQFHTRCDDDGTRFNVSNLDFDTSYTSLTGHFIVHYDTTGSLSPSLSDYDESGAPDYIEEVALAAEAARLMLTDTDNGLGYIEEIPDPDGKYDIYINISDGSSLWGQVVPIDYRCSLNPNMVCTSLSCNDDSSCGVECGVCESVSSSSENDGATYMRLRRSYPSDMSQFCDNSNDLLWLTVGHEFFHSVQYAYKKNAVVSDNFYREFTSMWFENVFVPSCFDFLDFVDMSSSYSLFKHPERAFDASASSGHYGYSLTLYGHYLSTLVDTEGNENQINSTIMREVWENYGESSSTVFNALKSVLEHSYDITFIESWADFMSRIMFCGLFSNMINNDIYYHSGQAFINPPELDYHTFNNYSWQKNNEVIYSDRVNIYGFNALDGMSASAYLSSGNYISWYGEISSQSARDNISGSDNKQISNLSNSDKFFFLLGANNNPVSVDLSVDIEVSGCVDPYASNYNLNANTDEGNCEYLSEILSIYPNPVDLSSKNISISLVQSETSDLSIKIFDVSGRQIYSDQISVYGQGFQDISLDLLSSLSSGIYFVHIRHFNRAKTIKLINIK